MTPVIGQADRAGWQRSAAAELSRILEFHPDLPCITWTIGPTGAAVIGRVSGLASAGQVRQDFLAWRHALGLEDYSEQHADSGTAVLRAADRSGRVTVRLTATVFGAERGGA